MLDDLKIRNKLILLLAGPLIITLLLSALGARDRKSSASDSSRVERLVTTSKANADVVAALQQEALFSASFVGAEHDAWAKQVKDVRTATDAALANALDRLQHAGGGSGVSTAADVARGAAEKLGFYRKTVDQGFRPDQLDQLVVNYSELADTFLDVNTSIADAVSDPQAAADLRTGAALATYKSSLATQAAILAGGIEAGELAPLSFDVLEGAASAEQQQLALLKSISSVERKGAIRDATATEASTTYELARDRALEAGANSDLGVEGGDVAITVNAGSTMLKDLHGVETASSSQMISAAHAASSRDARAANLFLFAALVAIGGAIAAAVVLGRRITRPLGHLTEAADRLSSEQMPKLIESLKSPTDDELGYQIGAMRPIEIDSDDEIGRLAKAFNEVQRVAGDVAAEQAQLLRKGIGEMFVNLARRNQALLDRQIEFIDELERGEEDPDQLENLYRLDHLATRMRRNAESLLVLAGAEPPRRRGRPAPLANVVRAALAEVEDFGRIELLSFDEVLVASNAAADLAHLLSELMENATNFSPPETRVEVVGHKTKADGYVISITDHGIGMSADQIAEANESLARPPLVGLAMSRSLGFIVVGRLAARHGIAVRMMPSAAGGVTAVVSIAPSLVVDTPGGVADADPHFEPPARLKPVLGSPGGSSSEGVEAPLVGGALGAADDVPSEGPSPLTFTPLETASSGPATPPPVTWGPPPEEVAASATSAVDEASLPTRSIFDEPAPTEVSSELAAEVDEAVAPAMPAALSFDAPTGDAPLDATPRSGGQRPFFLEDAEPPRAFGEAGRGAPVVPRSAPEPELAPTPRLFGGPAPAPAPAAPPAAPAPAPAASAPAPLVEELPEALPTTVEPTAPESSDEVPSALPSRASAGASGTQLDGPPPLAPRRPAPAPPAPTTVPVPPIPGRPAPAEVPAAEAAPVASASTTTASGLAKRVPRSAGGARTIPGSEVERGVSGSRRSPEEIRKMLAQHSAGRQRARTQEPVPAGAPEEEGTP